MIRFLVLFLVTSIAVATSLIKENEVKIGRKDSSDVFIFANNGSATPPYLKFDFSEGQWKQSNDGSAEVEIGSGSGGGGINFISNPDLETDASGYNVFDDAQFPPIDGTGGTTSVTVARNTTTPLRGLGDLLFTKTSGADLTGEGFSTDFTIDNGYQGNMLTGSFLVNASDTDCVDEALKIAIYDITNTQIIRVNGEGIGCSDISYTHYFQFPAAFNSTSYRLIFTYDNTDVNEVLYYFDEINVGPTRIAKGAVLTNYKDGVCTSTWDANGTTTCKYRQVGDSLDIIYNLTLSSAPSGALNFNMPNGFSIDYDKVISDNNFGSYGNGSAKDASAGAATLLRPILLTGNDDLFRMVYQSNTSGGTSSVSTTTPFTWASGDQVNLKVSFPIEGLSANAQLSEDLGNSEIAFYGYLSVAQSVTTDAETTVLIDAVTLNKGGGFDTANNKFVVPESGLYVFTAKPYDSSYNDAFIRIRVKKNGTDTILVADSDTTDVPSGYPHTTAPVELVRGDEITFTVDSVADTSYTLVQTELNTFFSGYKLHSPQTMFKESSTVCQTKYLSSNQTSNITFPDLTFNNLTVGKSYRETVNLRTQRTAIGDDNLGLIGSHNASSISLANHTHQTSTPTSDMATSTVKSFTATATTLTHFGVSIGVNSQIFGDGSDTGTWVELCELPNDFQFTTKFD